MKKITIKNYRGIRNLAAQFQKHLLVVGHNAAGKTSLAGGVARACAGVSIPASVAGRYQNATNDSEFRVEVDFGDAYDGILTKAGVSSGGKHGDPYAVGYERLSATKINDVVTHLVRLTDTRVIDHIAPFCDTLPHAQAIKAEIKAYFEARGKWNAEGIADLQEWKIAEDKFGDDSRRFQRDWMHLAGEKWGSEKGANWLPQGIDHRFDEMDAAAIDALIAKSRDSSLRREGQAEEAQERLNAARQRYADAQAEYKRVWLDEGGGAQVSELQETNRQNKETMNRAMGEVAEAEARARASAEWEGRKAKWESDIATIEEEVADLQRQLAVEIKRRQDEVFAEARKTLGVAPLPPVDGNLLESIPGVLEACQKARESLSEWLGACLKQRDANPDDTEACPKCGVQLRVSSVGKLTLASEKSKAVLDEARRDAIEQGDQANHHLAAVARLSEKARRVDEDGHKIIMSCGRKNDKLKVAKEALAELPPPPAKESDDDLAAARARVESVKAEIESVQKWIERLQELSATAHGLEKEVRAAEERLKDIKAKPLAEGLPADEDALRAQARVKRTAEKAQTTHERIMVLEGVRYAVGAKGIRAAAVEAALRKFEAAADDIAYKLWGSSMQIRIEPGKGVTANERPLPLLSESEGWLVDLAYQLACAAIKPPPCLVVDRLDILDEGKLNGGGVIDTLRQLAGNTPLVVCGTENRSVLDAVAAVHASPDFAVIYLKHGEVEKGAEK